MSTLANPRDQVPDGRAKESSVPLTVFFDGACPLCRREIAFYRRRTGAEALRWVDVSAVSGEEVADGLRTRAAMERFHVRTKNGHLYSGARAFAELWAVMPGFRLLGRVMRWRPLCGLLEMLYRQYLKLRPRLQRLAAARDQDDRDAMPRWLVRELRSDHAGEAGAVQIYRGILATSTDADVRAFAVRHLETESRHLERVESVLPERRRSRLLPLWKAAGWMTGALPGALGAGAVFATIDAVETFVDGHYGQQIEALAGQEEWRELRELLEDCRADEVGHRDEARAAGRGNTGAFARGWAWLVGTGSGIAVAVARRI